ncbi:MAG: DUF2807 domain-containing protein [Mucilaginibacter polytrichastri]|nr:DUF2807 domain-containing protein [Mucilaginibacter polytrichastri]
MKNKYVLLFAGLLFAACSKENISANGNVNTESRDLSGFSSIESHGSNPIHIAYGKTFELTVRGSENLLRKYQTRVVNGTLRLGYDAISIRNDDVEVWVTLPEIEKIGLNGSGNVDISGAFPNDTRLKIDLRGSSDILARDLFAAEELRVDIAGSGSLKLEKIQAKKAYITMAGSGEVFASVSQKLDIRISGSGAVYYWGNPQEIEQHIGGSGKVIKK